MRGRPCFQRTKGWRAGPAPLTLVSLGRSPLSETNRLQIPGADRAVVDPIKVRDYLLSLEHPVGRGKARFFLALGFSRSEWSMLQRALLSVATESKATPLPDSPYGQKYEARAILQGPRGQAAEVVTIWIILAGEDFPRLVTAYPGDAR